MFWLAFDLYSHLDEYRHVGLSASQITQLCLMKLPELLTTVLPVALLLSLLYTLTNHARHNELVAMRAAGVSLWRVCLPYLTVGIVLGGVMFCVTEFLGPRASARADELEGNEESGKTVSDWRGPINFVQGKGSARQSIENARFNLKTGEITGFVIELATEDGGRKKLLSQDPSTHAEWKRGGWMFYRGLSQVYPKGSDFPQEEKFLDAVHLESLRITPEHLRAQERIQALHQKFEKHKPQYVLMIAAKVGGIKANRDDPVSFLKDNIIIQTNLFEACYKYKTKKNLFLGSSCVYPTECKQPMKEEYLLSGKLELTNEPYALAKIVGLKSLEYYNRQFKTNYVALMPTNLYGPGDNYDSNHSHVIPGLIRKVHEAKENGNEEVLIWGSGTPRREFMYSQDFADACVFLLNKFDDFSNELFTNDVPPLINVGVGHDLTIQELGQIIGNVIGYQGKFRFDTTKPDGTPRKLLDSRKLTSYGWKAKTSLIDGISCAYEDFVTRYAKSK